MQVHLDGLSDQDIRTQPWKDSIHDARGKYYNFREHPELIRQVLEDFKPHEESESIQKFYEMLEWINGPDSNFESSDCRLTGPEPNMQKEKFHWDIHAGGRLMVFFRNLPYNVTPVTEDWVTDRVQGKARLYEPSRYIAWLGQASKQILEQLCTNVWWPIIQLHYFPTFFQQLPGTEREKFGYQLVYEFHSWSDNEEQILDFDLLAIFNSFFETLKIFSADMNKSIA